MIRKFTCLLAFTLSIRAGYSYAQNNFDYNSIPKNLLTGASAVIRNFDLDIEVVSLQEADITKHYAITILNEKADKYADFAQDFSELISIESISGAIYDENGTQIKKLKQNDFITLPVALFEGICDDKIKIYRASYHHYPYTIEYTSKTIMKHTFLLPYFAPAISEQCSIASAICTLKLPDSLAIQYKSFHFDKAPTVIRDPIKTYTWEMKNIPAEKQEIHSYSGKFTTPTLLFSLNDFMLGDFIGNANSWKNYGAFIYDLNKCRDTLPYEVIQKVQKIVAGMPDKRSKIAALYSYLQQNMRYVSVQYGIGGWQPLDARYVAKNQYGDCKALSNYMMSLLEAAGIPAYPVLIYAGVENQDLLMKDIVVSQFDHVILCVPMPKDTVWLECTSSDLPAGYLSDFTQNRDALMITPAGGFIVHTPVYDSSVNYTIHHAAVTCTDDGNLKIKMHNTYAGEAATQMLHTLKYENDNDKNEFLHTKFRLPSYTIDNYSYHKIDTASISAMYEDAELTARSMYNKNGARSFLSLNIAPKNIPVPEEMDNRKTQFYIPESQAVYDTFDVAIPANQDVEFIPQPVCDQHSFGSYCYSIEKKDSALRVVSRLVLNAGTYPPEQYNRYAKMCALVTDQSHKKVVFKSRS